MSSCEDEGKLTDKPQTQPGSAFDDEVVRLGSSVSVRKAMKSCPRTRPRPQVLVGTAFKRGRFLRRMRHKGWLLTLAVVP